LKILKIMRKDRYSKSIGGELYIDGQFICYTLELPWKWNRKNVSCIPPGKYPCFWRHNRGRVQLQDIPCLGGYRVAIQIHSGNKPVHTKGCILVGETISTDFVGKSKAAMRLLEGAIHGREHGPGYSSKTISLIIEGILGDSRYDEFLWDWEAA